MTRAPMDVAAFHADFDRHPDDRIRLFAAVAAIVQPRVVLYPGSYVDIAPSVHFPDVVYVDTDRRAARFFDDHKAVKALVRAKRAHAHGWPDGPMRIDFHHRDYTSDLPLEAESVDLLVSLYAGFVSETCLRYLRPNGHLLVNPSHGDAAMASLDPELRLAAVVTTSNGRYSPRTDNLDRYLVPKRGHPPTVDELHRLGRGIGYTKTPFAYLFERCPPAAAPDTGSEPG